ncbi:hypothetical protein EJB05_23140 [Eragrostis curvula]|uniref:Uncharacterized protein n=1 Tax=Eragrostis curvula TaxID=38414 RepID=A0A5J9V6A3_9POAL|nr:hypothetical protein EJB05_23140 [Eragrostis curvula]
MAAVIRNALLRSPAASLRSGAVAAAEARLAGPHPLLQLLPASSTSPSSRALHHLADGSLSLAPKSSAATITRRNASSAKQIERTRELVEEKKAALLQQLLKEEADAVVAREKEEEKDRLRKMLAEAEKEIVTEEEEKKGSSLDSVKEKNAKAEELLALIGRQAASGVEQDKDAILLATLLAWSLRSDKAIEDLQADVRSLETDGVVRNGLFYAGAVTCFFYWLFH